MDVEDVADDQRTLQATGGGDDAFALGEGDGDGFFEEDVGASFHRSDGIIGVRLGVGADADGGGLGVYNLTKAALIHFTRQLASEIGPNRVIGIAPGLVKTDFAGFLVENFGDKIAATVPLKRLGEPEDIANLATFLASDSASWITGETYVIDGGAGLGTSNAG